MRTENDLRRALIELEPATTSTAGMLDRVRAGAARRRQRRRAMIAIAAVTVVAAAIPVGAHQLRHSPGSTATATAQPGVTRTPSARPSPTRTPPSGVTLRFGFESRPTPGYLVVPSSIEPDVQRASIYLANVGIGRRSFGDLTVYTGPDFDASLALRGEPVTVNGRRGYYASLPDPDTGNGTRKPALAWEYAPSKWAVVQGDWTPAAARGAELALARAVSFDGTRTFAVPYRAVGLPANLHPFSGLFGVGGGDLISVVELTDLPLDQTTAASKRGASTTAVHLDVRKAGYIYQANATVGGRPAYVSREWVQVYLASGYALTVSTSQARAADYPAAVLRRIAEAVQPLPDPTVLTQWVDALTALPR